jgi:hypothetical protein
MNTRDKTPWLALLVVLGCASPPSSDSDDTAMEAATGDDDDSAATPGGPDASRPSGDGSKPMGAAGPADCSGDTPEEGADMLTTFEDGTVGLDSTGGWVGGFYIFNDKMNDAKAQTAEVRKEPRCADGSSEYAYCSKGSGFTVWGAGIGTDLGAVDEATKEKSTVDLSKYSGVSFWVKRNGGMATSAKVIIPDANTSDEGGSCSNESDAPATMKCDPFTTNLTIPEGWTKQTVMFSSLKQGGWGKAVPGGFADDKVFGVQLQFGPGMSFDVCIDQVVLVR